MDKPLFKASEGGRIDMLREWEGITESELQQGSGTSMLLALRVRPEAFPDRFSHVRIGGFLHGLG